MEPKVNFVMVGAFLVLLGMTVLGVILWLGKSEYRGEYDRYWVYTQESVAGLSVDSTVKYRGVEVGRVKEVVLNPDNPEQVRVRVALVRGTPVKTDTEAMLVTQGLTGLVTLNLTGGSRDAPLLQPSADPPYPAIKSAPSLFGRLDKVLSQVFSEEGLASLVVNFNGLARNASSVLDEETRMMLKQMVKDLSEVSRALAASSGQVDRGVRSAAQAAEQSARLTGQLDTQLPLLLERVTKSAAGLEQMSAELARTGRSVGEVVGASKPDLERFSHQTLAEMGLLIGELRQLTATLNHVAQQIERQPNVLVLGRSAQPKGPGE